MRGLSCIVRMNEIAAKQTTEQRRQQVLAGRNAPYTGDQKKN